MRGQKESRQRLILVSGLKPKTKLQTPLAELYQLCAFLPFCLCAFILSGCASHPPLDINKEKKKVLQVITTANKYYEDRNLSGYLSLWSKYSPDYKRQKRLAENDFKNMKEIKIKIEKPEIKIISSNLAEVSTESEFNSKLQIPTPLENYMQTKIVFKKKEGLWKVWRLDSVPIKEKDYKKVETNLKNGISPDASPDEKKILTLAKEMADYREKRDLNKFFSYWHPNSPNFAEVKREFKKQLDEQKDFKMNIKGYLLALKDKEAILTTYSQIKISENISREVIYHSKAKWTLKKEKNNWKLWELKLIPLKAEKQKENSKKAIR